MNRNVENHFAQLPQVNIGRSIFDRSAGHKTSFNCAELIPFFWDEYLPGDTFQVTTSVVMRLQTLLTPLMDNVYADIYWYAVDNELLLDRWKQFMGESDKAWLPETVVPMPLMLSPEGGFDVGTIADYLGVPVNVEYREKDAPYALPFRAYAMICNEWFRDQNLTDPLNIPTDSSNQQGTNGSDLPDPYIDDVANGGKPFLVSKYHDYFTSALPSPQRNTQPVGIDMNASFSGSIPVYGSNTDNFKVGDSVVGSPVHFMGHDANDKYAAVASGSNHNAALSGTGALGYQGAPATTGFNAAYPVNLVADPTNAAISGLSFTINELRLAYSLQKFYEKNARGGTRLRELIMEHFGVRSADARMHIPEYLGGHRFPLSIHQVANTSQGDGENQFLGDLGAMSSTSDVHADFIKSFSSHGIIMGLVCVRYDHSYPQGLSKMWRKRTQTDYYWPVFANLGEQPILKSEICLTGASSDGDVFGYQEAWAEYRYMPNRVSGEMRPGINNSLASWHLADYYEQQPSLSDSWIREDKTNVDRALAYTSEVVNQVFADFYVKNIVTRPMPMYSIPGLADHH